MSFHKTAGALALLACAAMTQQPNSGFASMTINGVDGAPFPILTNIRTSLPAGFAFSGATNQPYFVFQTGLAPVVGSMIIPAIVGGNQFNQSVDIPLSPFPVSVIDGFQNAFFNTGPAATHGFSIQVPPAGNPPAGIPLGTQLTLQGAISDPFSSIGVTLTAATRITVTQGPTVVSLSTGIGGFGASGTSTISLTSFGFTLPFYGVAYSSLHLSGDGYMTFGTQTTGDFTPTESEMNSLPPRIAGFWTDLDQNFTSNSIVRYTIDSTPGGGNPPFLQVDFIDVPDAQVTVNHTFSWKVDSLGTTTITMGANQNPSIYNVIVGIGPGNNLNPTVFPFNRDLSALLGSGIVGAINESFYEHFGLVGFPNWPYTTSRPYDLFAPIVMTFAPAGTGSLPGSSNRYQFY